MAQVSDGGFCQIGSHLCFLRNIIQWYTWISDRRITSLPKESVVSIFRRRSTSHIISSQLWSLWLRVQRTLSFIGLDGTQTYRSQIWICFSDAFFATRWFISSRWSLVIILNINFAGSCVCLSVCRSFCLSVFLPFIVPLSLSVSVCLRLYRAHTYFLALFPSSFSSPLFPSPSYFSLYFGENL